MCHMNRDENTIELDSVSSCHVYKSDDCQQWERESSMNQEKLLIKNQLDGGKDTMMQWCEKEILAIHSTTGKRMVMVIYTHERDMPANIRIIGEGWD